MTNSRKIFEDIRILDVTQYGATILTANGGELMVLKSPHKFSKTPPEIPGPAAMLGEHSSELLRSLCGYSDGRIKELIARGLVVDSEVS